MKKNKKTFLYIVVIVLTIILAYICNIDNIPNNLVLFQEEIPNIDTLIGIKIETKTTGNFNLENQEEAKEAISRDNESIKLNINLFGITVKEVSANLIDGTEVIPLGDLVGMKLYTNGILVVGMSEIYGEDDKVYKPYESSGIKEGDKIVKIDDQEIQSTEDLIQCINSSKGEDLRITYIHKNETIETSITPVQTEKNAYKIGLWVRDTAAGIGTATFYDAKTKKIATLGHGIQDIDTEELIDISKGELTSTDIVSIQKGEEGEAGRIQGTIEEQETIGTINRNTYYGVYGELTNTNLFKNRKSVKIAPRNEIQLGDAELMCEINNNEVKSYKIKIKKIYLNNNSNNKSMLIEIVDNDLLEQTGGIIQGMSGSPIIQNGKLIGALTHVLIQKPKEGYAVFAEQMIKER